MIKGQLNGYHLESATAQNLRYTGWTSSLIRPPGYRAAQSFVISVLGIPERAHFSCQKSDELIFLLIGSARYVPKRSRARLPSFALLEFLGRFGFWSFHFFGQQYGRSSCLKFALVIVAGRGLYQTEHQMYRVLPRMTFDVHESSAINDAQSNAENVTREGVRKKFI